MNLFRLDRIIKYKKGRFAEKQQGLSRLRNFLSALKWSDPPLQCSHELSGRLFPDRISEVPGSLKHYEDLLDGYVCAYLALYYWRWGDERNELIGDLESGYIVVPRRRSLDEINLGEGNTNYVNPQH